MSKDEDIDSLITLGFLAVVGYGVYKVLKSFGSHKTGDNINYTEISAPTTSSTVTKKSSVYIPTSTSYSNYEFCPICKKETEQCQYRWHRSSNKCIECNGGEGYKGECNECYHDQNSDDD